MFCPLHICIVVIYFTKTWNGASEHKFKLVVKNIFFEKRLIVVFVRLFFVIRQDCFKMASLWIIENVTDCL